MFEYYKWRLANKPVGNVGKKDEKQLTLGRKVWGISLLLAVAFSNFIVFAPLGGILPLSGSLICMVFVLVWLVTDLMGVSLKELKVKLIQSAAILLVVILLMGLLFGGIAVMLHNAMRGTHHLGQIAMTVDLVTRAIVLLVTPVIIITFFRFMHERKIWQKIRKKTYLELLIVLAVGLLASQIPNAAVFRSLILTYATQFLIFIIINTLLITAVITTCRNRGILK